MSSRPSDQHGPPSQPQPQASNRGAGPSNANANTNVNTTAFPQSSSSSSQFSSLSGAGASYDSIAGSSPAAFSDSSFTLGGVSPSSPAFDTEPAYTTVNGHGHVNGHTNGYAHEATGMYQFGAQQEENWGVLMALQNPSYWKDMMMPGCVCVLAGPNRMSTASKVGVCMHRFTWPESPQAMQDHAMTNGFDTTFGYQMAAPLSG